MLDADVKGLTEVMATLLPPVDKKFMLESDEVGSNVIDSFQEGLKKGTDGWVDDDLAFISPWGFDISEVKCPVFYYHGTEDLMVPYAHGEWIAKRVPEKFLTAHLQEGEGHISIFAGQVEGMVDELMSVGR